MFVLLPFTTYCATLRKLLIQNMIDKYQYCIELSQCDDEFGSQLNFFLISQNQSASGNVIQHLKKRQAL